MKYKGFVITPYYSVGSTFRITKDGRVVPRRPTKDDLEYYEIYDPMENDKRHCAADTIGHAKAIINDLLYALGMKSNLPKEWEKLGD